MSDEVVIQVEKLGKRYRIRHQQQGGMRYKALRDVLADGTKSVTRRLWSSISAFRNVSVSASQNVSVSATEDFWALKDVSFEVRQGETLGIIGRNGAGKSTLLKILSRITEPTEGRVRIKGRVASLLEVGTGFHPELTGRENIFLNGAILGMHRAEIKKKFDEIVAFAEVEKFLDTPVKRYSSGMYVRLAFAVAAHLEPEILVVDEVLAVGDASFQRKCLGKMSEVAAKKARTVLFVSHNMAAVKTLCSSAMFLESGRVHMQGETERVISNYLRISTERTKSDLLQRSDRFGNGKLRWTAVRFLNKEGEAVEEIVSGEEISIVAAFSAQAVIDHQNIIVAMSLWDEYRNPVAGFVSDEMGSHFTPIHSSGSIRLHIPQLLLRGGTYSLRLLATHYDTAQENFYDLIEDTAHLRVIPGDFWRSGKTNRTGSYSLIPAKMIN
jgi:lipopolysaccharide transport system ATP-binding protein